MWTYVLRNPLRFFFVYVNLLYMCITLLLCSWSTTSRRRLRDRSSTLVRWLPTSTSFTDRPGRRSRRRSRNPTAPSSDREATSPDCLVGKVKDKSWGKLKPHFLMNRVATKWLEPVDTVIRARKQTRERLFILIFCFNLVRGSLKC